MYTKVKFDAMSCCAMRRAFENIRHNAKRLDFLQTLVGNPECFNGHEKLFIETVNLSFSANENIILLYDAIIEGEEELLSTLDTEARLPCGHSAQEHWDALEDFLKQARPARFIN